MPYCYGSALNAFDENDLLSCSCDPGDPIVAHADLVGRLYNLLAILRDKRRARHVDRMAVRRLGELALMMRWGADVRGHQRQQYT
jgi:hypothetical protein